MSNVPHIVIIGAGFGGLSAAKALARSNDVRITIIDKSNHHLFQPLLYQAATAALATSEIASPIRGVVGHYPNVEIFLGEVTGIDAAKKAVRYRSSVRPDCEIGYDQLIIATGAHHSYFNHPEWERVAPGLKSIDDATGLRRKILMAFEAAELESDPAKQRALLNFVIVGGGPTGVELAGAISELAKRALVCDFRHIDPSRARIVLLEAGPRILAAFPEDLSRSATGELQRLGVEVRTGSLVSGIDEDGVSIGSQRLESRTVIWAAGVQASPAGRWLGAETDRAGRVKVTQYLALPMNPDVFVIGDTALVMQDGKPLPGLAPVAMQQGRYVAKLIRARARGRDHAVPFRYRDRGNLATVGRAYAIADVRGFRVRGFLAWLLWVVVHIYYLISFRNRVIVITQWAWAYLTSQRGARIIVGVEALKPSTAEQVTPAEKTVKRV